MLTMLRPPWAERLRREGLTAFWRLGEVGTGNRADTVGSHTLTDVNTSMSNTAGLWGEQAALFGGVNSYLETADADDLSAGPAGLTVCGWARKDDTATDGLVEKSRASTNNREWRIQTTTSNRVQAGLSIDGTSALVTVNSANNAFTVGVPFFFALRHWPGGQFALRIDNGPDVYGSIAGLAFAGSSPLRLGALEAPAVGNYLTGTLQDVGVWQRPLTDQELSWRWFRGAGRAYPWRA